MDINQMPRTVIDGFPLQGGKTSEDTHALWEKLSSLQQQAIMQDYPSIGNLDGLPAEVKNVANRIQLTHDLSHAFKILQSQGISPQDVLSHPLNYHEDSQVAAAVNVIQIQYAIIQQSQRLLDHHCNKPVLLLKYNPYAYGWRGAAIISLGNPDTSTYVAFMVPGTGENVHVGWLASSDISNLAHEMFAVNPDSAVVAIMDYQLPDSPVNDFKKMSTTELAHKAAPMLAADVNGFRASHQGKAVFTVIGHSYGSTIVADACVDGMHPNNVILLGSPGIDLAKNESDLHLDGGRLYVGANTGDVVSYLGSRSHREKNTDHFGLGSDPATTAVGGVRFHAQQSHSLNLNPIHDHTLYYEKGSESLYNIADIAAGNSQHLSQDGMIAPRRVLGGVVDPEIFHHAHAVHYHDYSQE